MDDDWDVDEPVNSGSSTPPVPAPPPARRGKWEGEDEEEEEDDWDAPSEDEKPKPKAAAVVPPKKKMTLKQKLAEKERLAREKILNGDDDDEDLIPTMTEQDRRRQARERELEADMDVAADLMGDATLKDKAATPASVGSTAPGTPASGAPYLTAKPKTKDDFNALSKLIVSEVISQHSNHPLFASFAESLAKDICESLNAVQTRKVSSTLSVLGNTKQAEEREKASGKKKGAAKPKLGGAKTINRVDTEAYDDVLGDDDFM